MVSLERSSHCSTSRCCLEFDLKALSAVPPFVRAAGSRAPNPRRVVVSVRDTTNIDSATLASMSSIRTIGLGYVYGVRVVRFVL